MACFDRHCVTIRQVRRLNLFEPRWLNLLDRLAADSAEANDCIDSDMWRFAASEPSRLVNATIGCVFAVNRCYTPAGFATRDGAMAGIDADRAAGGERVADVVLRPVARRCRIVRAKLSRRPVSGDRKLEVWLQGGEPLALDALSLAPTGGGYLAARVRPSSEEEYAESCALLADDDDACGGGGGDSDAARTLSRDGLEGGAGDVGERRRKDDEAVRVVSVVGLAHANGVLDRCAASGLCDARALASVGPADEPDWVGY